MRATEGVSGMIPRQEYEILAFMHEFYRWPEILRDDDRRGRRRAGRHGHRRHGPPRDRHQGQLRARLVHRRRRLRHGPVRSARPGSDQGRRLRRGEQRDPEVHAARAVGQAPGRLHPQLPGPLPLPDPRAGLPRLDRRAGRAPRAGQPEARAVHPVQRGGRAAVVPRPLRLPSRPRRHRPLRAAGRQAPHPARPFRQRGGLPLERRLRRRGPPALLHPRAGASTPRRWVSRRSGSTTSRPPSPARRTTSRPSSAARCSPARSGTRPMGEVYPIKIDDLGEHLGRVQTGDPQAVHARRSRCAAATSSGTASTSTTST